MKKMLFIFVLTLLFLKPSSALTADKVVIIPLGKKEATGNAESTDVLEGKTFSNAANTNLTGSMTNNGAVSIDPSTSDQTIPEGYHNGSGIVKGDANLISGNIQSGVIIFGVSGTHTGIGGNIQDTSSGDANASDILSGKKAWVDGAEVTGSIPSGSNVSGANGQKTFSIPDGYYSGNTATANDTNLASENIKDGVAILGVSGTHTGIGGNIQDTSSGDANASDILSGKKAWVDGAEVTGSTPSGSNVSGANGQKTFSIPDGYYSGNTATANDTNLASENIKDGVAILGVSGTHTGIGGNIQDTSSGDANASDILSGKKAWVDGAEVTGSIPSGSNVSGANGQKTFSIPDGYYSGNTATANDTNLASENIKDGVAILGVSGTHTGIGGNIQDTSSGDANASDILSGKKAWVDGAEVTGSIPSGSNVSGANGQKTFSIPDGYYSGNTATANDTNLASENIKDGVAILGVSGNYTAPSPYRGALQGCRMQTGGQWGWTITDCNNDCDQYSQLNPIYDTDNLLQTEANAAASQCNNYCDAISTHLGLLTSSYPDGYIRSYEYLLDLCEIYNP